MMYETGGKNHNHRVTNAGAGEAPAEPMWSPLMFFLVHHPFALFAPWRRL